jgi:hypothetical protein
MTYLFNFAFLFPSCFVVERRVSWNFGGMLCYGNCYCAGCDRTKQNEFCSTGLWPILNKTM